MRACPKITRLASRARVSLVMMMRRIGIWLGRGSVQKFFFPLFLGPIVRPFWIISFHLHAFFGGQLRKVPDKQDQFPAILFRPMTCESRHAREAHAVFNDPEKFTIGKFLRLRQSHVGGFRIEALADERVAAAVIGMARGAMVGKVQPRLAKIFRGGGDGVARFARVCGNGQMPRVARHHRFQMRGRSAGAQPVVENTRGEGGRESCYRKRDNENDRSAFHGAEIYPACYLDGPSC